MTSQARSLKGGRSWEGDTGLERAAMLAGVTGPPVPRTRTPISRLALGPSIGIRSLP